MTLASNPEGGSGALLGHEGALAGRASGFPCAEGQKSRAETERKEEADVPAGGAGVWGGEGGGECRHIPELRSRTAAGTAPAGAELTLK